MKLKDNIILTEVGDDFVAIPIADAAESFRGIIRLNESAAIIWRGLRDGSSEDEIAERMLMEYEGIDLEHAKRSVHNVVEKLMNEGILEA